VVLPAPPPKLPRPGFWEAVILTVGFAVVLFGTVLAIIVAYVGYMGLILGIDVLKPVPGTEEGSAAALQPKLLQVIAVSFPVGYAAGLFYTLLVLRLVIGRGWTREVGLRRLPPAQLGLGLLALPGFVILSDAMARVLYQLFRMEHLQNQGGDLNELLQSFHWSFAVLAVGIGPGLVEELWCRGFLGRGLIARNGWWGGVLLTSLFFGVLHLYPPPHVLVTAAMGACLHFAYIASRSLWVPIAMHLLNNSFAALAAVKAIPTEGIDRAAADHPLAVVGLAVGLLLSVGAAMWTARARWVGEPGEPAPTRGIMVPVREDAGGLVDLLPHPVAVVAAIGCCVALLWLLLG
jgi:membrane protease YdiL (CAAX protease family)